MNKRSFIILIIAIVFSFITVIAIVSCEQKNPVKGDGIDTYALLDYMTDFVRYVNKPIHSKTDIEQTDFLYFLFELSQRENKTQYGLIDVIDSHYGHAEKAEQHTVSSDTMIEYMENYFGIGKEYFDKYKTGYEYKSPYDFYDAKSDTYKFIMDNSYLWASNYSISRTDTKIYITGDEITVKTMYLYDYYTRTPADEIRTSADYTFTAHRKDGKTYYRLNSADTYEDDRNKNTDVVLSVDGTSYTSSWYTVERNGKYEYYTPNPFIEAGFHSWSIASNPGEGLKFLSIKNNTACFIFVHNKVYDVYLFDIERKTGRFMSGVDAEDFSTYYEKEMEYVQNVSPDAYLNYYIVSMPPESDFALMCRTKSNGKK